MTPLKPDDIEIVTQSKQKQSNGFETVIEKCLSKWIPRQLPEN